MLDREFNLQRSTSLLCLLVFIFTTTFVLVFTLTMPWWLKTIVLFFISAYGFLTIPRVGLLQGKNAIRQIRSLQDGTWHINTNSKNDVMLLQKSSIITNRIAILHFCSMDRVRLKRQTCVIFPDALAPGFYRQLQIRVRYAHPIKQHRVKLMPINAKQ